MSRFQDVTKAEGDAQWKDNGETLRLNFAYGVFGVGATTSKATIKNSNDRGGKAFRFNMHRLGNLGDYTSTETLYLLPKETGVIAPEDAKTALQVDAFAEIDPSEVPADHQEPPNPAEEWWNRLKEDLGGAGWMLVAGGVAVTIILGLFYLSRPHPAPAAPPPAPAPVVVAAPVPAPAPPAPPAPAEPPAVPPANAPPNAPERVKRAAAKAVEVPYAVATAIVKPKKAAQEGRS